MKKSWKMKLNPDLKTFKKLSEEFNIIDDLLFSGNSLFFLFI